MNLDFKVDIKSIHESFLDTFKLNIRFSGHSIDFCHTTHSSYEIS